MSAGTLAQHGSLHPAGAAGPPQQTQPELSNLIQPTARNTLPLSAAWLCDETPGPALELDINGRQQRPCGVSDARMLTPVRVARVWAGLRLAASPALLTWVPSITTFAQHQTRSIYTVPNRSHHTALLPSAFVHLSVGYFGFPAELFSLPPGMRSSSHS